MEEIIKLYNLMASSGVPSALCNVFIIIGSLIFYNHKLGPFINKFLYRRKLISQSEIDSSIKSSLREYREIIKCDRIAIFEFHNNIHNLSGKSFIKFTCTYETCRVGVPASNINCKELSLSGYKEILDLVVNNEDIFIRKSELDKYSSEINKKFDDSKLTNLLLIPVHNKGFIIGFLSIDYTRDAELTNEDFLEASKYAHELAGKISNKVEYGK